MNKVLDSREPTPSTRSLWLPRVPSGSWGEELAAISGYSESPWTLCLAPFLCCWRTWHRRQTKDTNEMEEKNTPAHRCTMHYDKIIIKNHLNSQSSAPNPRTGTVTGLHSHRSPFYSSTPTLCDSVSRTEAALQVCGYNRQKQAWKLQVMQESTGVLVTKEQLLILCDFNEWYKRS